MGFLGLLGLPLTGPFKGLLFVATSLTEEVERSWYDEEAIRGALLEMELQLQDGEIGEAEYAEAEAVLLERLAEARRRRGLAG
ncbi:MAG: gas vesicle protein GvpG [Chloroflexi bacterium]|nr:gas vesicle protein GvpG [Chloroflexota bacterium]